MGVILHLCPFTNEVTHALADIFIPCLAIKKPKRFLYPCPPLFIRSWVHASHLNRWNVENISARWRIVDVIALIIWFCSNELNLSHKANPQLRSQAYREKRKAPSFHSTWFHKSWCCKQPFKNKEGHQSPLINGYVGEGGVAATLFVLCRRALLAYDATYISNSQPPLLCVDT